MKLLMQHRQNVSLYSTVKYRKIQKAVKYYLISLFW